MAADDGQGNAVSASTRVVVFPVRLTAGVLAVASGLGMLLAAHRRRKAARLEEQLEQARQEGFQAAQRTPADD